MESPFTRFSDTSKLSRSSSQLHNSTSFVSTTSTSEEEKDPVTGRKKDRYKPLMAVIRDHGYPIERHFYETQDGYINCVHRISGPRGTSAE